MHQWAQLLNVLVEKSLKFQVILKICFSSSFFFLLLILYFIFDFCFVLLFDNLITFPYHSNSHQFHFYLNEKGIFSSTRGPHATQHQHTQSSSASTARQICLSATEHTTHTHSSANHIAHVNIAVCHSNIKCFGCAEQDVGRTMGKYVLLF